MEFGIFNSEGCIEQGLFSQKEAEARMAEAYTPEDGVYVAEVCHDHPEFEKDNCEECNAEEEE